MKFIKIKNKYIKNIISITLMFSLVFSLAFSAIKIYTNSINASADDYDDCIPIYVTPIAPGLKINDVEVMSQYNYYDLENIEWYSWTFNDYNSITPITNPDEEFIVTSPDLSYILTLDIDIPDGTIYDYNDNLLDMDDLINGDCCIYLSDPYCNDDEYNYCHSLEYSTDPKLHNIDSYTVDTVNKKIICTFDVNVKDYKILNLDLYKNIDTTKEKAQISDLNQVGADMTTFALSTYDSYNDSAIYGSTSYVPQSDEVKEITFSYKDGNDYAYVKYQGKYLFEEFTSNTEYDNDFKYYWKNLNNNSYCVKIWVSNDDYIDDIDVDAYGEIGANYINIKISSKDLMYNLHTSAFIGVVTKEDYENNSLIWSQALLREGYYAEPWYFIQESDCFIAPLIDKPLTVMAQATTEYGVFGTTIFKTVYPQNPTSSLKITTKDIGLDTPMLDVNDILCTSDIDFPYIDNNTLDGVYAYYYKEYDDSYDASDKITKDTKLHSLISIFSFKEYDSIEIIAGDTASHKKVTLNKNTNLNLMDISDKSNQGLISDIESIYLIDQNENTYNYYEDDGVYIYILYATLDYTDPDPSPGGGGSSGSSHSTKTYKELNENNGDYTIIGKATKGNTRTIIPSNKRRLKSLNIYDTNGNKLELTCNNDKDETNTNKDKKNNTYKFTQPASDIKVEISFMPRVIKLYINNKDAYTDDYKDELDTAPIIRNDRTMLPIRYVAKNLDADVSWDKDERVVTLTKGDTKVVITIGSDIAYINDKEYKLDSVAFIENDRTYLPVRFIVEAFNSKIYWNEEKQEVTISEW